MVYSINTAVWVTNASAQRLSARVMLGACLPCKSDTIQHNTINSENMLHKPFKYKVMTQETLWIDMGHNNMALNCWKLMFKFWPLILCMKLSEILVFQVSQGSAATHLRWGGKYYMTFVGNLVLFPTVKEFWKSVNIWQSYSHPYSGTFFYETHCNMHALHARS